MRATQNQPTLKRYGSLSAQLLVPRTTMQMRGAFQSTAMK